jgi:peroxiredoxin
MSYLPIDDKIVDFEAWFNDKTGLLEEARFDLTRLVHQLEPASLGENERFFYRVRFTDIRLNEPIPADRFVFMPSPNDKRKAALAMKLSPEQRAMLGKPTPDVSCRDMDGRPVGLEQLKGRVVLLQFWATWCRGCIRDLSEIQKLAERYVGKPVAVIGVNQDQPGSKQRVTRFLKDCGVSFPQWLDNDQRIGKAYCVSGLPHTVLIDTNGNIQTIQMGSLAPAKLAERIDRMLESAGANPASRPATRPLATGR